MIANALTAHAHSVERETNLPFTPLHVIEREQHGGPQVIVFFCNGYGVSVICNQYSLGGREGLFEVALIRHNNPHPSMVNTLDWHLVYQIHAGRAGEGELDFSDPIGYLDAAAVRKLADRVANL